MIAPRCTANAIAWDAPNAGSLFQISPNGAGRAAACNGDALVPSIRIGANLNHSFKFSLKPLPKRWVSNCGVLFPGGSVIFGEDPTGARYLGAWTLMPHLSCQGPCTLPP